MVTVLVSVETKVKIDETRFQSDFEVVVAAEKLVQDFFNGSPSNSFSFEVSDAEIED